MPDQNYPTSLNGWLDYFLARKLPSALSSAAKCRKLIEEGSPSYLQIAKRLEGDPVISLAILREANISRAAQRESAVFSKTLDHAMSMLGHAKLNDILKTTPKLEEKYGYRAYYQILSASLTKAHLAYDFAVAKKSNKALDVFWGSLFSDAALWYCWCYTTPLMRKVEKTPHAKQVKAADQAYHCDFISLQRQLLEKLGAPELAIACKTPEHCLLARDWATLAKFGETTKPALSEYTPPAELSPKLKIARQNPQFFIELAGVYCHYILNNQATRPAQRARALSIAAAGLDIDADSVHRIATQSALYSARHYPMPFCNSAISSLMSNPLFETPEHTKANTDSNQSSTDTQTNPINAPDAPATTKVQAGIEVAHKAAKATSSIDVFTPSKDFLDLLKKMKNEPHKFDSTVSLMNELAHQIQTGLLLERCAVMLFNKEKTRIKTYFCSGIEKADPLHTFEAKVIKGTIFKVLSDKSAALWLKPSSKQEVSNLVPMNFKQITQRDEQLFASVFTKEQALAILYADAAHGTPLREEQFRYFKLAAKALEAALTVLGTRKPKD